MNAQSKPHCMVSNLLACTAALLVLSGSPALAQDTGTLDKGKVVEQPQPYSPYAGSTLPAAVVSSVTPTTIPRCPWTAA